MARALVVLVELAPLEEPTTGLWCPACALPSGLAAHFALALNNVAQRVLLHRWCTRCGRELDEAATDGG